ncbi:MAG: DNA-3-methyladenine glycosylase [Myxococcota bacterium]|nr:DNA-3-methyladenine glycosylase [Myxococcota bacterium]
MNHLKDCPPMIWTPADFQTDARTLAKRLIGHRLIRQLDGHRLGGIIVETEAYLGTHDRAAHSFGGRRTARIESMYGPAGTAYVYLIYGLHHCFNIVCGTIDEPTAVLIRAIEPTMGIESMRARRPTAKNRRALCSGPGKLCAALAIDRQLDGHVLEASGPCWVEHGSQPPRAFSIDSTSRIGVDYAGAWAQKPLRFCLRDSPFVSKKP